MVRCLRSELNAPGLSPLNAEELHFWFQNITIEDIEAVNKEIDAEASTGVEHPSRVQSMLQKIREKMRGGEGAVDRGPERSDSEKSEANSPDTPNE